MINERREGMEIDLQKLLLSYLHNWWIIAAFAVGGCACAGYYGQLYHADV